MRQTFLEKEGAVTLDDLLRIARSQDAVDRQMKVKGTNSSADHVNAVGGKSNESKRLVESRYVLAVVKMVIFVETRRIRRATKLVENVVVLGISWLDVHSFNVVVVGLKVLQVETEVLLVAAGGAASGGRVPISGGRGTTGGGRFRPGRTREANQVVGGDDGEQFTGPVQQSPEYAFLGRTVR